MHPQTTPTLSSSTSNNGKKHTEGRGGAEQPDIRLVLMLVAPPPHPSLAYASLGFPPVFVEYKRILGDADAPDLEG